MEEAGTVVASESDTEMTMITPDLDPDPEDDEVDEEDVENNVDVKVVLDADLLERVDILEDGVKTCRGRLDAFSQELKILLVEINIVCEWIKDRFGIELIDKGAHIFKHIHDFEEIEELSHTLSLVKGGIEEAQNRSKMKYRSDDDDDDEDDDDDDDEDDDDGDSEEFVFDPPECVIHEQISSDEEGEGRLGKRRATRRRINYSELAEGIRRKKKLGTGNSNKKGAKSRKQRKPYKWRTKEERELRKQEKMVPKKRGRPKKKPEERVLPNKDHPPMMCEECGKILKGPGSLKSHMDMHADRRPFPCPMEGCDKKFRVKNKLAIHMIIHKGEKREQCRFCGRLFYFQKDLARHERTHTGEKPHNCHLCTKSFNVKQHLTLHIRTHTGERPYKCPTCEKTFSQANSLRIHKKIHMKVKGAVTRKPRGPSKHKIVLVTGLLSDSIAGTSSQSQSQNSSMNNLGPLGERSTSIYVVEPINSPSPQLQPRQHHNSGAQTEQKLIIHSTAQEIIMDPVQQAWKLASEQPGGLQNSLGTVQFPIYGFDTQQQQQHRHGIIQNPTVEQRMFPPPQFGMSDPNIRYFTGE